MTKSTPLRETLGLTKVYAGIEQAREDARVKRVGGAAATPRAVPLPSPPTRAAVVHAAPATGMQRTIAMDTVIGAGPGDVIPPSLLDTMIGTGEDTGRPVRSKARNLLLEGGEGATPGVTPVDGAPEPNA